MRFPARWFTPLFVTVLLLASAGRACAERARFHFAPTGPEGALQLIPEPDGSPGARVDYFGKVRGSYCEAPIPTCRVKFKNCHTGQDVIVPLALPDSTPIIEHVWGAIVYDYGGWTVEIRFLPDGGVDVTYNSGLFRKLVFPQVVRVPGMDAVPLLPAPGAVPGPPPAPAPALPTPRKID